MEPLALIVPTLNDLVEPPDFIPPVDDRDYWMGRLDATGARQFLTMVASGFLPAEIALVNGIPLLYFEEWFEVACDKNELRRALKSCAQLSVSRSKAVLKGTPLNQGEAILRKSLSERLAWQAERVDPERWGTSKAPTAPPPPISITMNMAYKPDEKTIELTPQKVLT